MGSVHTVHFHPWVKTDQEARLEGCFSCPVREDSGLSR